MKVSIQNLGRVKKASLDLSKKLTILTGQNNSGKTWISYLIHGIFGSIQNDLSLFDFSEITERLVAERKVLIDLEDLILPRKEIIGSRISNIVQNNLSSIFKADRDLFARTTVKIDLIDNHLLESIKKITMDSLFLYNENSSLRFNKSIGETTLTIGLFESISNVGKKADVKNIQLVLTNILARKINIPLFWEAASKVYMMPAERIAINTFSKEISLKRSEILQNMQSLLIETHDDMTEASKILRKESARYAQPIHNALLIAEDLLELQTYSSEFEWLAQELEKEILKGKISVNQEGVFEFKPQAENSQKIGIHLTGSVVKTFASLVFYFRHLAEEGDFIIIDEPEINLHPDNQVILAKILAKISNAGFRLMISTHSEYLLKEFNFFLYMNNRRDVFEKFADKYGYSEDVLLNAEDLNVFLLKEDGSFLDIQVEEDGFDIETIDDVIDQQAQKAADIWGWS